MLSVRLCHWQLHAVESHLLIFVVCAVALDIAHINLCFMFSFLSLNRGNPPDDNVLRVANRGRDLVCSSQSSRLRQHDLKVGVWLDSSPGFLEPLRIY